MAMERRGSRESAQTGRSGRDDDDRPRRRGRDEEDERPRRSRDDDDDRPRRRDRDDDDDRRGTSGSRGFKYQERTREQADKRSHGNKDFDVYINDKVKLWTPRDGDNTIRILPPTWDKPDHYGVDLHVHYGIGADSQAYLCLDKHKGDPCCICEERAKAKRDGDEEYAKEIRPVPRTLVYLIDRNNEKEGVQAWAMPASVDQDIVKVSVDKRNNSVLPIDHPEDGFDVEFERTGKNLNTKYKGIAISRRSSPLGKDAWLQFAIDNPLPEQLVFYGYDHIAKVFGGGSAKPSRRDQDDDDHPRRSRDEDEDRPRRRGRDDDDDRPRRSRDEDEDPRRRDRDESPRKPKKPTYKEVMRMDSAELEKLVQDLDLDIKVNKADSDEELAEWIIEDLGLSADDEPQDRGRGRDRDREEDSTDSRLSRMRQERGR